MARYRNDMDDDRDYYAREDRLRRENFGSYDEPSRRRQFDTERRPDFSRGRFGERAEYNYDEPRYANTQRRSLYDTRDTRDDVSSSQWRDRDYYNTSERSRLRCRD